METSTKTSKQVLALALVILNRGRKAWAMYLEECEQASKEGYRPHYCFHGTNLWTDYDNICGMCEDHGNYWNYQTYAAIALGEATRAFEKVQERHGHLIAMMQDGAPSEVLMKLNEWALEPVARLR
jgi:hypothetical protein